MKLVRDFIRNNMSTMLTECEAIYFSLEVPLPNGVRRTTKGRVFVFPLFSYQAISYPVAFVRTKGVEHHIEDDLLCAM